MHFDKLLKEAEAINVDVYEKSLSQRIKGLYGDNVIWINKNLSTTIEKACVLAEELGHHYTSVGDILDQSITENRKQEKRARSWAYEKLVPLERLVQAFEAGCKNRYELAEYLDVTEEFLQAALDRYKEKYGLMFKSKEFTIFFEPLAILKMFEEDL